MLQVRDIRSFKPSPHSDVWPAKRLAVPLDNFTQQMALSMTDVWLCIPYSGKLSREKTFAVLWLFAKVSLRNLGVWHPLARQK